MEISRVFYLACILAPLALMSMAILQAWRGRASTRRQWHAFQTLACAALVSALLAVPIGSGRLAWPGVVQVTPVSLIVALLVQFLGLVVGRFSARYLEGETGQRRYMMSLAAVLAAVHLLLMADHWLLLIAAWTAVGVALRHLLCFYPERPFARLAAHKKHSADRVADLLLLLAAALAWREVGSGSLSALWSHVAQQGMSTPLQASALALVAAVILRSALLPVHGWLIQVMEAPTPVSALLHAGVVNLGGFVLIRFAPMLNQALPARILLLVFGLTTAVLAGMVMLTRISVKVRLAWSTVAQMGFMLLECALGLHTLAAIHLIGHSLYKAHAFLSASGIVRHTRLQAMHDGAEQPAANLVLPPVLATAIVLMIPKLSGQAAWPWWWSAVLGLAWAPMLWSCATATRMAARIRQSMTGPLMVAGLTTAALLMHALPLGLQDAPHAGLGMVALAGMAVLYGWLALLQRQPQSMPGWRRWSYAGFYLDEAATRLALHAWPARWAGETDPHADHQAAASGIRNAPRNR